MLRDQRRIYFFDLSAYSRTRTPQTPNFDEMFAVWQSRWQRGEAQYLRAKGTRVFGIKDMAFDDDYVIILISIIDKNMPDAAYGDLDTGETTVFAKEERQGNSLTAHLLISRRPRLPNKFMCLLEGVPKITAANVSGLLSKLLHDGYTDDKQTFTYPDPGGAKEGARVRRISYLPHVRLLGHISQRLISDLEKGRIRHINLTRSYEMRPFNEDPYMREETASLKLAVSSDIPKEGRWDRLKNTLLVGRGEYVAASISFVAPDGRVKDVEYDMENDAFEDESYIRSELLNDIEPHLADASSRVVPHLADRMRAILAKEG